MLEKTQVLFEMWNPIKTVSRGIQLPEIQQKEI